MIPAFIAEAVSKTKAFAGCNIDTINQLLSSVRHRMRTREAGMHIAYMGDQYNDMVILVSGSIYSSMTNIDGKEIIVGSLDGPTILAPSLVFAQNKRLPVNEVAKTDCTLLYIDINDFATALQNHREMMVGFMQLLSDRCEHMSRKVNEISLLTLKERVIDFLKENLIIDNVAWLARVMGVARPSLSRVLSELKADGTIYRTIDGLVLKKP